MALDIIVFALLTPLWSFLILLLLRFINLFTNILPTKISGELYVNEESSEDLMDYAMWLEQ